MQYITFMLPLSLDMDHRSTLVLGVASLKKTVFQCFCREAALLLCGNPNASGGSCGDIPSINYIVCCMLGAPVLSACDHIRSQRSTKSDQLSGARASSTSCYYSTVFNDNLANTCQAACWLYVC